MQPDIQQLVSEQVLSRPAEQRLREWRHRTWQTIIFGLPVLFLQWFGSSLGGPEAARWVPIFQALLAGWIVHVAAVGVLVEGIMLLIARGRLSLDSIPALLGIVAYLFSAISLIGILTAGHIWYRPLLFHIVVIALGFWSSARWWLAARR